MRRRLDLPGRWAEFIRREPRITVFYVRTPVHTLRDLVVFLWPEADFDDALQYLVAELYPDLPQLLAAGYTVFELQEALVLSAWPDADDATIVRNWQRVSGGNDTGQ